MRAPELVAHLLRNGLQLSPGAGALSVHGSEPRPDLAQTVCERRDEILALLAGEKYAVASYSQQRVWFLAQATRLPEIYNLPVRFELRRGARPDVLARCIDEMTRRHEILRTAYVLVGGQVVQRVEAAVTGRLAVVDLSELPPPTARRELEAGRQELAREVFDLARGPVWRPTLFRLPDGASELLVCSHHICTDAASMGIFGRELEALYAAFSDGRPSDLKEVEVQYGDFAAWQRASVDGPGIRESLEVLQRNLEGREPELRLPWDRTRPAAPTFAGGRIVRTLRGSTFQSLRALRRHRLTPFQALLGIFALLMAKYTGQTDFVLGCPVDDRLQPGSERSLGFFVNTMLVRCELDGDPTVVEALHRIRGAVLGNLKHRKVPFDLLVERFNPDRQLGRQPLFEVMFSAGEPTGHGLAGGNLVRSVKTDAPPGAKFDLTVIVELEADRAVVNLDYSRELFDSETIERMARYYERLLQAAAAEPERRISELELVDAQDGAWILNRWSRGPARSAGSATLTDLFAEARRTRAAATALVSAGENLTYEQLDRRANRTARRLLEAGIRPESLVGVLMKRSTGSVVSMLAVIKAGGAYLPLDPTYPEARLRFMVEDSGARLILTDAAGLAGVAAELPARALDVGEVDSGLSGDPPAVVGDPRAVAYVMYTSGSTGKPKGVAVTHEGIARLVHGTDYVELGPGTVMAHASNISFDAATFEVWGALLNGGRLVVLPDESLLSGAGFATEVAAHGIDTALLTTALVNQLARDAPGCFGDLESLVFGGEAADVECLRSILAAGPPRTLINAYGPTENACISSVWPVGGIDPWWRTVPIGRPIADSSLYLFDPWLRLVPAGIGAEIFVAGAGLARGYPGDPRHTAERFLPDPYATEPGQRMYRTGDRGSWNHAGEVEFRGRRDDQIKLRGFRIELGELEGALRTHPRVREALVLVRSEDDQSDRLEAFVSSDDAEDPAVVGELLKYLRTSLPRFMVPSRLVTLRSLPLTPNGKVDGEALLALPDRPSDDGQPVDHSELKTRILALVWSRVLGVDHIRPGDSFFDLGGHSLAMMQVISKIKETFDVDLPVASFYNNPTLEAMTELIRREQKAPLLDVAEVVAHRHDGFSALALNGISSGRPLFCIHSAGGHLVEYRLLAEELARRKVPVFGLQAAGLSPDGADDCQSDLVEMAGGYADAIEAARPEGPLNLLGYCIGGVIAYEIARQLRSRSREVELLAVLEAWPSATGIGEVDLGLEATLLFGGELKVALDRDEVAELDGPDSRLRHLWRQLRHQAAERADHLDFDLFRRLFRVYSANLCAERRYRPDPYEGKIVLIEAQYQRTRPSAVERWQVLTASPVRHLELPGNHLTVLRDPYVRVLATRLAQEMGIGDPAGSSR